MPQACTASQFKFTARGVRLVFEIKQLALWRDQRPILRNVALRMERPGLLFVVGPGGSGKSSFLGALRYATRPAGLVVTGEITLDGVELSRRAPRIVHVPQGCALNDNSPLGAQLAASLSRPPTEVTAWARRHGLDAPEHVLQQLPCSATRSLRRTLGLLSALEREADIYLLDEPTAGVEGEALDIIRACIGALARRALVIVATHNRRDCLSLGGHTALLAGGRIQEFAPSTQLFTRPVSPAAQTYVATGNCTVPASLTPQAPQAPVPIDGLWWLVPGLLCGMSRPGLMANEQTQFQRLAEEGVSQIVCLEERCAYPTTTLRELGIAHYHFPVVDMGAPSFSQVVDICRLTEPQIGTHKGVAMHCRGGLGRTGTVLASLLVWHGDTPDVAIHRVRAAQPHAIQNEIQLGFVHDFASRISAWH